MNAYQAGQKLLCGAYSSYTPTGKSFFVKAGRWGTVPHPADIVYFYTSSLGRVSHVGVVIDVELLGGLYTIHTIEGNTAAGTVFSRDGGCVAVKSYAFLPQQVGGTNRINGFGTPAFGDDTCSAEQLISIAKSQIGYVEKASNKDLDDFRANPGDKNWTKYGKWYGLNPAQWCQMFVSWCAHQAAMSARENLPAAWIQQENGTWKYRKNDGQFAKGEWQYINGRWYVFDENGIMITGWFKQADGWYYLAGDGGMLSGQWFEENGKSYYLTESGLMASDAYVRADKPYGPGPAYIYYFVNSSGEWAPSQDTERPDLKSYDVVK